MCTHSYRAPNGIRTRVTAVKGRCPRPLDDGDVKGWERIPAGSPTTQIGSIAGEIAGFIGLLERPLHSDGNSDILLT